MFSAASLNENNEIKERSSRTNTACRFRRYIDDFFVLGTNKKKVMKTYEHVSSAFGRTGLPPKPSKRESPQNMKKLRF